LPIYEYECKRCGTINSFFEKVNERRHFWNRHRCQNCGGRRLKRILSTFSAHRSLSTTDMLNDLSKMGQINFVPRYPGYDGPPPGGCPYAQEGVSSSEEN
jgi:putative FmdB family regulatory protein